MAGESSPAPDDSGGARGRLTGASFTILTGSLVVFLAPLVAGSPGWATAGALAACLLTLGGWQLLQWDRLGLTVVVRPIVGVTLTLAWLQFVSTLWSIDRDATLKAAVLSLAATVLVLLFSSRPANHSPAGASGPDRLPGAGNAFGWQMLYPCTAVVAGLLWVSAQGISQYIREYHFSHEVRAAASFLNPDIAAGFVAMALPVCLAFLWLDLPALPGALVTMTAVAGALMMTLTGSKGGWLALAGGLAAMAITRRRHPAGLTRQTRLRAGATAALCVVAVALSSGTLLARVASAGGSEAHSFQFRWLVWKSAWRMLLERPWTGFGAGTFGQAYPHYAIAGPTDAAHCSYLQAGAECGFPGMALLVAAVVVAVLPGFRKRAREDPRQAKPSAGPGEQAWLFPETVYSALAPGLVGGLVAAAIHNMVDFDWSMPGVWLVFWAMAGTLGSGAPGSRWSGEPAAGMSARLPREIVLPRQALLAPGIAMFIVALLAAISSVAAHYAEAARSALEPDPLTAGELTPDPRNAMDLASRALRMDPLDSSTRVVRAQAAIQLATPGSGSNPTDRISFLESADTDLQAAAKALPLDSWPVYLLAGVQQSRDRSEAAVRLYQQALERDPHCLDALWDLAVLKIGSRHRDEATQWLQRLARIEATPYARIVGIPEHYDPHFLRAWATLAQMDAASGRWVDCEREARHALKDLDDYAALASRYASLAQIWPIYQPSSRRARAQLQGVMSTTFAQALLHLGRSSEILAVKERERRFKKAMDAISNH